MVDMANDDLLVKVAGPFDAKDYVASFNRNAINPISDDKLDAYVTSLSAQLQTVQGIKVTAVKKRIK